MPSRQGVVELCKFRLAKKLTQKEIARRIGVSESYYSKIEGGYKLPSFRFLKRLKAAFPDADIDELFFE